MLLPYYNADGITIYNADCRAVLPQLEQVDATITDPPYDKATHDGARTNPTGGHNGVSAWDTGGNEGQPLIDFPPIAFADLRDIYAQLARVNKTWLVSFMDYKHVVAMETEPPDGLRFVRFGIWVKPNGAPQFTGDRPGTGWEGIAIMHALGGRMKWNGGGHHATYRYNKVHTPKHKTEKPLDLVSKLIEQFSNPGDVILDPFMGSGTTLVAARALGRRAIGIELDERWCNHAVDRLSQSCMVFA